MISLHDIVYDGLPDVWYLKMSRADVRVWFHATWTATQSIPFLTASGVRSQRKLQQILDPTVGLGASGSKSTCGFGAMEGPSLFKSLWSKLWNCAKRGCTGRIQQESKARGAETLWHKSDRAWAKGASAPQWITARVVTDSLKPITSQPYDRHFKVEGFINKCRVPTKPTLIFAHDEREVDSWW
jgi:hypothetical protein